MEHGEFVRRQVRGQYLILKSWLAAANLAPLTPRESELALGILYAVDEHHQRHRRGGQNTCSDSSERISA